MIKDYKKFRENFTKVLNSYTDEEVLEWIEMDRKRMALVEKENRTSQAMPRSHRSTAKLNGAVRSAVNLNVAHAQA